MLPCVTKFQKFSSWNTNLLSLSSLVRSPGQHDCLQSENQGVDLAVLLSGRTCLQIEFCWWQHSVSCCCRTQLPISLTPSLLHLNQQCNMSCALSLFGFLSCFCFPELLSLYWVLLDNPESSAYFKVNWLVTLITSQSPFHHVMQSQVLMSHHFHSPEN